MQETSFACLVGSRRIGLGALTNRKPILYRAPEVISGIRLPTKFALSFHETHFFRDLGAFLILRAEDQEAIQSFNAYDFDTL
jgi:hypothetical protein